MVHLNSGTRVKQSSLLTPHSAVWTLHIRVSKPSESDCEKYFETVKTLMEEFRGRELPGTYVIGSFPYQIRQMGDLPLAKIGDRTESNGLSHRPHPQTCVYSEKQCARPLSSLPTCSHGNVSPGRPFPRNWSSSYTKPRLSLSTN